MDAEQQAEAEIGQHETQQIMLDVPVGQIHLAGPCTILPARPTRSPLPNWVSTDALSGTPLMQPLYAHVRFGHIGDVPRPSVEATVSR